MMAVIVGTFAVCWAPFAVMFILLPHNSDVSDYLFKPENAWIIEFITWIGTHIGTLLDKILTMCF